MKHFLFAFFAFFVIISTARSKEIVSIGDFKIGMSVSEFLAVAEIQTPKKGALTLLQGPPLVSQSQLIER
jgi:hypothetical protein